MPSEEVWLKMKSDHGGGSSKMAIQVLIVTTPNSKELLGVLRNLLID